LVKRRYAPLLFLLALGLPGCKPVGPKSAPRAAPSYLFLSVVEGGVGRFLPVDLSKEPPAVLPAIEVVGAAVADRGRYREPMAAQVGPQLVVILASGEAAKVARVGLDGSRVPLQASARISSSSLAPRPLRAVGQRLFLVSEKAIFSTLLDDGRAHLEPLDTSGFHHFATLTGDLVTAHDLRVGDPFDWQILKLQESGSLLPVGRLANPLLRDVIAIDGDDAVGDGLLFLAGHQSLRSVLLRRGRVVGEPEASRERAPGRASGGLAALGKDLVLCGGRLATLPMTLEPEARAYELDEAACVDLVRRGPRLWALTGSPGRQLVGLDAGPEGLARVVARYALPGETSWKAIVR